MTDKQFPIMHDDQIKTIPWAVLEPHAKRAATNHHQTLSDLAARGGLSPCEAVAIIEDRAWFRMPFGEAREKLRQYAGLVAPIAVEDDRTKALTEAIAFVKHMRTMGVATPYHLNKLEVLLERAR